MKKVISAILLAVILGTCVLTLTGCTFQIETSDNQVTASVDGDTTEKVDGVLDWIKARIDRLFNGTGDSSDTTVTE